MLFLIYFMSRSLGQSVLVSDTHLGPMTRLLLEWQLRDFFMWAASLTRGSVVFPNSRVPQPSGTGPLIPYLRPQEVDSPVITRGTGSPLHRFIRLAGLWWRYSNRLHTVLYEYSLGWNPVENTVSKISSIVASRVLRSESIFIGRSLATVISSGSTIPEFSCHITTLLSSHSCSIFFWFMPQDFRVCTLKMEVVRSPECWWSHIRLHGVTPYKLQY
jgi:hypothetical protein